MWQQDPFQVDGRLLKECQSLETTPIGVESAASPNNSISLVSSSIVAPDLGWQRAASLVQSPASINSEGSATSTPDQCPASPAATFRDMPSSRNTSCNNTMIPSTSEEKQHEISQWKTFPSQSPVSKSSPLRNIDSGRWSQDLPGASQMASRLAEMAAPNNFFTSKSGQHDSRAQAGWSSILNDSEMCPPGGYLLEGLNEALVSKAKSKIEVMSESCNRGVMAAGCSMTESQRPLSSFSSLYQVEMQGHQRIKQEEEHFAGGRNALVIDNKVFSLQKSDMDNSKIGNFMDLLRHSDRPIPISEAAAAVSCNHLTQLLSGQEAPGMWIARSSRLPAMLSEVLPSSSGGKSGELFESRNKRPLLECSTSDGDTQDRQQHQEASPSLKQQDEDEPLRDRLPSFGIGTNDEITCELFPKRPRLENSNCFPFKMQVRKEKLGERISALQQLVSPFGKTDTASVLLEAIGYIKFLHEQVQVLSSPYMKHTSTATRHSEHGNFCWSSSDKEEDAKQDLRSRGLCLVPISCTLQVANDNGADYWTPTLHGGLK